MSGRNIDDALSEVIGFILIIAIIVILGSLYMTYVVPSEGRDLEIKHMQEVEKFFTDFKMNMDALWLNDQVGVSFNQLLSLGTGGQTSSGVFSIFPIMQPVGSFGRVSVVTDDPQVEITINGIWLSNETSGRRIEETQIAQSDTLLVVNYETDVRTRGTPNTLVIYSTKGDWSATLEIVNETYLMPGDLYWNVTPTGYVTNLSISKESVNSLALTVSKNDYKILDRMRINTTIGSIKDSYTINLLDEAYGLHDDVKYPFSVNYTYFNKGGYIDKGSPFQLFGHTSSERVSIPINIGSFSYDTSNKYWINQKYIYQLGGVFLEQNGIQTSKINPWMKIENKPGSETLGLDNIPDVNLNLLRISQIAGNISGSDTIQVSSKLLNTDSNFIQRLPLGPDVGRRFQLSNLRPNAAYVFFNITKTNPSPSWGSSWNQTLLKMVKESGYSGEYELSIIDCTSSRCTVSLGILGKWGRVAGSLNTTPDLFVNFEEIRSEISMSGPIYVN